MQSKPITALLVVIAALLAVNLIVNLPPQEAKAQAQPPVPPPMLDDTPRVVGIAATLVRSAGHDTHYVYRVWSDGKVERNRRNRPSPWVGWETVPE